MVRAFRFPTFFLLLAGVATATPSGETAVNEQKAIEEAMDLAMAEMFRPGLVQDGWDRGGVDVYKIVESMPGGSTGNFLLTVDNEGERSVEIVRARDRSALIPRDWKSVIRAGSAQTGSDADILAIMQLDGAFVIAGWESHRRVGDAFCSNGNIGAELYETNETAETEIPRELIPSVFHATIKHLESRTMCWRFDRDGDGFKITYFLEDGRMLPAFNSSSERVTIVAARPISELLKPTQ